MNLKGRHVSRLCGPGGICGISSGPTESSVPTLIQCEVCESIITGFGLMISRHNERSIVPTDNHPIQISYPNPDKKVLVEP